MYFHIQNFFFSNDFESIAATIQFHRPDLPISEIKDTNAYDAIPLNPPYNFFSGMNKKRIVLLYWNYLQKK